MKLLYPGITLFTACLLLLHASTNAQPDYTFKNAVLTSGIALQTGAVYKFTDVKGGTDAVITVKAQVGGVTLTEIDNNTTGFDEAFQPFINVAPLANGYIEFQVDFVSPVNGSLQQQNYIPVTCLDVDGMVWSNGSLYEQDQVQFFPGFYDYSMTGGNLSVTFPVADWINIKNTSGFSYPGIDTSAKDVMATVVNRNVSSFLLRIGAVNSSPTHSEIRYRSVYYKTFNYGHPIPLPNRTMISLSGSKKTGGVELRGTLSASHSYDKMIIERAITPGVFGYIGEIDISGTSSAEYNFRYLDTEPGNGINYYRIRLVSSVTKVYEITNTIMVKMDNDARGLELINTVMEASNPVLTVKSTEDDEASFQIVDMTGRLIRTEKFKIYNGTTNISLTGLNNSKGYFVIAVRTKNKMASQRVWVK